MRISFQIFSRLITSESCVLVKAAVLEIFHGEIFAKFKGMLRYSYIRYLAERPDSRKMRIWLHVRFWFYYIPAFPFLVGSISAIHDTVKVIHFFKRLFLCEKRFLLSKFGKEIHLEELTQVRLIKQSRVSSSCHDHVTRKTSLP